MNEDEQKSVQEKNMCKTYMITQESGNDVLIELCQKAENILKSLEDSFIDGSKHSNKERYCNYFKYWLNFKAKQIGLENYIYSTDFYNKIICENKCEENARYKSILEEFHGEFDKTSKYLYQLQQVIKKEEL
ncbi:hypothetical protein POVWA2_085200 [Plasmodium ovale wallikeri]|uniref:PIR Superfamily Protein n=1 Tax=Plasmodium ovale wallikeri TaxID=864142 RepID=A0A1A9AQK7_PLAOA|nr:hypothetical protein POVWA2_085200 [Plasmodium ovale wallikeri]